MDHESQPLLDQCEESEESCAAQQPEESIQWKPIALSFLLTLVSNIGYFIMLVPQTRLFEDIVCTRYYSERRQALSRSTITSSPDESWCKVPEVQGLVAELFGMQQLFEGLIGILLGLYFGALADRIGRRPVFVLSTAGTLLSATWILFVCWIDLPIRLVWLSSAFLVIGGGSTVTNAVLTMILTDATPANVRSRVFLYFSASVLGSEVIAPPIASFFMDTNYWIPLLIGLFCTAMTVVIAMIIPESLPPPASKPLESDDLSDLASCSVDDQNETQLSSRLHATFEHIRESLACISSSRTLLLLTCIYTVSDFARQSLQYILQYVSVRYQVSLTKANYLLSWRAAAAIALNTLVLPSVDTFLVGKIRMHTVSKDMTLARVSISFLTVGFAVIAAAPRLWVVIVGITLYTPGSSFGTFMRSIISIKVESRQIGTIYSTLAIMNTIGALLAGPILAQSLKWSVRLDGLWKGLPYIVSFVLCGIPALVLFRLKVRPPQEEEEGEEGLQQTEDIE